MYSQQQVQQMSQKHMKGPPRPSPTFSYSSQIDQYAPTTTTSSKTRLSTDPVRGLIEQQSFDGSWILSDEDIQILTKNTVSSVFQSTITNNRDALTTAFAIAYLESKHSNESNLWKPLVEKARKRLLNYGLKSGDVQKLVEEFQNKFSTLNP